MKAALVHWAAIPLSKEFGEISSELSWVSEHLVSIRVAQTVQFCNPKSEWRNPRRKKTNAGARYRQHLREQWRDRQLYAKVKMKSREKKR